MKICQCCKSEFDPEQYYGLTLYCFQCNFWKEKIEIKDSENVMRVNHYHYILGPHIGMRGFGGRMFLFEKQGKLYKSCNVWFQGEIPERFWNDLPDNAIFPQQKFTSEQLEAIPMYGAR
jgi:hypothetical protein